MLHERKTLENIEITEEKTIVKPKLSFYINRNKFVPKP
jgi:hypothetical protein